jgi:hypothetical protein
MLAKCLDYIKANLSQQEMLSVLNALQYLQDNWGWWIRQGEGWAICNGNNGTDNLTVGIGFGFGYSTLSAIGGEVDHIL